MRLVRIWTLIAALGLALAAGCEEDPMMRARTAHATEQADEAAKALEEVLAKSPKDFEARRLMADVHRFRGEFEKTEERLDALWKEKGFDQKDKEFPPEERAQRDLLENQFNELYSTWSQGLDAEKDAATFEKVVRAGLEWNKKSTTLNRVLVDHLLARADAEAKEGKKLEAAATYESILQLRAMPAQRKDAEAKAAALRKEAFADGVKANLTALQAELTSAGQWAEDTQTLTFTVEADVAKNLRSKKDADMQQARTEATPAIKSTIAEWVAKVTGVTPEIAAVTSVKMNSGDEGLNKGKYTVKISMALPDLIDGAFAASQKASKAAEKAAETPEPEPAEDAAGTNSGAGGDTNGGTNGKE